MPAAQKVGDEAGTTMGKAVTDKMAKSGKDSGDEFGSAFKKRLKLALDSLPKANIKGDASEVDRDLDVIRKKLEDLHRQNIIDPAKASEDLAKISLDLSKLESKADGVKLTFNTKEAVAQLTILSRITGAAAGGAAKKGGVVTSAESAIQTAAGAGGAGSSILGNIMNFFGGLGGFFSGGGGAGGGAGGAAGAAGAAGTGGGGGGGGIAAAIGGAGLAPIVVGIVASAAPFIGQIVGGAIIGILGAGLAGMGITGAALTGKLTKPFDALIKTISGDMKKIGTPFVGPLLTLFKAIGQITNRMTPTFTAAMAEIGPALGKFLDAIVSAFGQPSVQNSILKVADAFTKILNAVTPNVANDMGILANSIASLATTIAKNPQAMANVFNYIMDFINFIIATIGDLASIANVIEKWKGGAIGHAIGVAVSPSVMRPIGVGAAGVGELLAGLTPVEALRGRSLGDWTAGARALGSLFTTPGRPAVTGPRLPAGIALTRPPGAGTPLASGAGGGGVLGGIGHDIAHEFDNIRSAVVKAWNDIVSFSRRMAGDLFKPFQSAYNSFMKWWHTNAGELKQVWNVLWIGIRDIAKGIWRAIELIIKVAWTIIKLDFKIGMDEIKTIWGVFWDIIKGVVNIVWDGIKLFIKNDWDLIVGIFTVELDLLTGHWAKAWSDIKTTVTQIWHNIVQFFSGASTWLVQTGEDIIAGLLTGMTNIFKGITGWVNVEIYQPLLKAVKGVFGIHSPASTMMPLGRQIITGIIHGMIAEGKHLDRFIADIFGNWPNALWSYISKGSVNIAKLPATALKALASFMGGPVSGIVKAWNWITGSGGTGSGTAGAGLMANGMELYEYLKQNLFGGNKIAAAGATASIWGESGWNPFAAGTGGRGLIGWTPAGSISDAIYRGGMATQLPEIINFVRKSGDLPAILAMLHAKSVTEAANIWGKRVERYGINDVHSTGLSLASSFMKYDAGGWLPPGVTLAYNMTGKPERVVSPDELVNAQLGGAQYHAHFDGLTGAAIESHVRTAFQAMTLTEGNLQRQGRRS